MGIRRTPIISSRRRAASQVTARGPKRTAQRPWMGTVLRPEFRDTGRIGTFPCREFRDTSRSGIVPCRGFWDAARTGAIPCPGFRDAGQTGTVPWSGFWDSSRIGTFPCSFPAVCQGIRSALYESNSRNTSDLHRLLGPAGLVSGVLFLTSSPPCREVPRTALSFTCLRAGVAWRAS